MVEQPLPWRAGRGLGDRPLMIFGFRISRLHDAITELRIGLLHQGQLFPGLSLELFGHITAKRRCVALEARLASAVHQRGCGPLGIELLLPLHGLVPRVVVVSPCGVGIRRRWRSSLTAVRAGQERGVFHIRQEPRHILRGRDLGCLLCGHPIVPHARNLLLTRLGCKGLAVLCAQHLRSLLRRRRVLRLHGCDLHFTHRDCKSLAVLRHGWEV